MDNYEARKKYHANYYQKNKKRMSPARKKYYQENKEYFKEKADIWYQKNKEKKANDWRAKRLIVLQKYGGECSCCHEKQIEFLAIDHINNDGHIHRKTNKINIYDWLIKNNYPDGVQILCHNCNNAKAFYGRCPHND